MDGCELEVNLDSRTRSVLVKRVREGAVDVTTFDSLQATAEKQMIGDSLPRYLKSDEWKSFSSAGSPGTGLAEGATAAGRWRLAVGPAVGSCWCGAWFRGVVARWPL